MERHFEPVEAALRDGPLFKAAFDKALRLVNAAEALAGRTDPDWHAISLHFSFLKVQ